MDAVILEGLIAAFVLVLAIGGLILDAILGIDPDISGTPWTPGDPRPGAQRRPCLDERCRIDHEVYRSSRIYR